jgi:asparagine synthase (glutamine-hydrolysing)
MQASAYHGIDRSGTWNSGAIALGQHQLCTTPESEFERQPTSTQDGSVCVSFDGRLDNREALLAALDAQPAELLTDVDLLIRAYLRWGLDCVDHLVGDFGFALWDARERRLFCARDPLGIRPVYYAQHHGGVAVATGLRELVAARAIPLDVNEGMVGEYLTGTLYSVSDTLYRHAFRLPPGHRLTVDARGVHLTRYWKPEEISEIRITPGEATERFRTLFFETVRCRTRSQRPVAAHLSGGLDSSSVVSVLGNLQTGGELAHAFEAFTLAFPGLDCDETHYARLVAEQYAHPWHCPVAGSLPADDYEPLAAHYLDFPGYPNGSFSDPMLRDIRDRGLRVVLTGMGGDDWLAAASPVARTLDLLGSGRMSTLRHELKGFSWPSVTHSTLRHLAVRALDRAQIRTPRQFVFRRRLPPWLTPDFVRRTQLAERISALPPVPRGWSFSRAERLSVTRAGLRVHPLEVEHRSDTDFGLETRHPFYDVRLVEFLLALPDELCANQQTYKVLLREAMRGVLPEPIRTRESKATFGHSFLSTLKSDAVRRSFNRMGVGSAPDWIDGPKARAALHTHLSVGSPEHRWPLWSAFGIDVWLHAIQTLPVADASSTRALVPPRPISENHGLSC